jgi:hypothetical protein
VDIRSAFHERRRELNGKLRAAYLAGAEGRPIWERGRGLSEQELPRVMRRYPGDLPEDPQVKG